MVLNLAIKSLEKYETHQVDNKPQSVVVLQPELILGVKVANMYKVFSLLFNDHQMALIRTYCIENVMRWKVHSDIVEFIEKF